MTLRSELIAALDGVSGLTSATVFSSPAGGGDSMIPEGTERPYVRLTHDGGRSVALSGDGRTTHLRREFQVSLFETLGSESEALATAIIQAIDGLALTAGLRAEFEFSAYLEEVDAGISHIAMTFSTVQAI